MTRFLKTAGSIVLYGMISATSSVQATEPDQSVNEGQGVVTALGTETFCNYLLGQPARWLACGHNSRYEGRGQFRR